MENAQQSAISVPLGNKFLEIVQAATKDIKLLKAYAASLSMKTVLLTQDVVLGIGKI